jgi:hypothetical protein
MFFFKKLYFFFLVFQLDYELFDNSNKFKYIFFFIFFLFFLSLFIIVVVFII